MKLYKLLFLLDFEVFRSTGKSVTGLHYEAWRAGPVPADFHREWEAGLEKDLRVGLVPEQVTWKFDYENEESKGFESKRLTPKVAFNEDLFSPVELDVMRQLAARYLDASGTEMSLQSHSAFGYWDEIWNRRRQPHGPIPYDLAFDRQNTERDKLMRVVAEERRKLRGLSR